MEVSIKTANLVLTTVHTMLLTYVSEIYLLGFFFTVLFISQNKKKYNNKKISSSVY